MFNALNATIASNPVSGVLLWLSERGLIPSESCKISGRKASSNAERSSVVRGIYGSDWIGILFLLLILIKLITFVYIIESFIILIQYSNYNYILWLFFKSLYLRSLRRVESPCFLRAVNGKFSKSFVIRDLTYLG